MVSGIRSLLNYVKIHRTLYIFDDGTEAGLIENIYWNVRVNFLFVVGIIYVCRERADALLSEN